MPINWFPGHMNTTRQQLAKLMPQCDVVVELLDARLPESSRNPLLDEVQSGLEPGARVWYTARWLSPTYEPGPVAAPACVRVGFVVLESAVGPRGGEQLRLAG